MGFERSLPLEGSSDFSTGRKCFLLAAAVFCNSLVEGLCHGFLDFYPILLEEFKVESGRSKIMLVGSLLPGIYPAISPLCCFLLGRFGFLVVVAIGSVTSSLGFIGSSLVADENQLVLCYTLLAGVGFGAIHLCCMVVVARTFDSYRRTAMSFVLAASALAGFAASPCTRALVTWYGWRGASLIYGGVLLNGVACGMIFNSIDRRKTRFTLGALRSKARRLLRRVRRSGWKKEATGGAGGGGGGGVCSSYIMKQMVRERERVKESSTGSLDGCVIATDNSVVSASQAICAQLYFPERSLQWKSYGEGGGGGEEEDEDMSVYLYLEGGQDPAKNINFRVTSGEVAPFAESNSEIAREFRNFREIFHTGAFVLYTITFVVAFIASFFVVMNLPLQALVAGLSGEQAGHLLTVVWATNALFRIPVGFACDKNKQIKFFSYSSALVVCGLLSIALPWMSSRPQLLVASASFGIFMACLVTLNPIFLLDILGVRRFAQSYSISSLFLGLSTMAAPLLPRWTPLPHSKSFIIAGIAMAIAGLASLPLRWLERTAHGAPNKPIG